MALGQRLRQARQEAGLSQRQLCGELITRNMLSQIENGSARPSMDTLQQLAQRLGKPVSWFLEETVIHAPGQQALEQARSLYDGGDYAAAAELLRQPPEEALAREHFLLLALCLMAQAEAALEEGRAVYAQRLLEQARQAGEQTPYFTPALQRQQLLLQAQAEPHRASELAGTLPEDPRELLLRAQAAADPERARAFLEAIERRDSRWHYLRGQLALEQGDYATAVRCLEQARQDYRCYRELERCYRELEDYKMAYHYACLQRQS